MQNEEINSIIQNGPAKRKQSEIDDYAKDSKNEIEVDKQAKKQKGREVFDMEKAKLLLKTISQLETQLSNDNSLKNEFKGATFLVTGQTSSAKSTLVQSILKNGVELPTSKVSCTVRPVKITLVAPKTLKSPFVVKHMRPLVGIQANQDVIEEFSTSNEMMNWLNAYYVKLGTNVIYDDLIEVIAENKNDMNLSLIDTPGPRFSDFDGLEKLSINAFGVEYPNIIHVMRYNDQDLAMDPILGLYAKLHKRQKSMAKLKLTVVITFINKIKKEDTQAILGALKDWRALFDGASLTFAFVHCFKDDIHDYETNRAYEKEIIDELPDEVKNMPGSNIFGLEKLVDKILRTFIEEYDAEHVMKIKSMFEATILKTQERLSINKQDIIPGIQVKPIVEKLRIKSDFLEESAEFVDSIFMETIRKSKIPFSYTEQEDSTVPVSNSRWGIRSVFSGAKPIVPETKNSIFGKNKAVDALKELEDSRKMATNIILNLKNAVLDIIPRVFGNYLKFLKSSTSSYLNSYQELVDRIIRFWEVDFAPEQRKEMINDLTKMVETFSMMTCQKDHKKVTPHKLIPEDCELMVEFNKNNPQAVIIVSLITPLLEPMVYNFYAYVNRISSIFEEKFHEHFSAMENIKRCSKEEIGKLEADLIFYSDNLEKLNELLMTLR